MDGVRTRLILLHCFPCGVIMVPLYPRLNDPEAKVVGQEANTLSFFRSTSQAMSRHVTAMT